MTINRGTVEIKRLEELCLSSVQVAIQRLCQAGIWPRPSKSRILLIGKDITRDDFGGMTELNLLIDFLALQETIKQMYLSEKYEAFSRQLLADYWLRFLLNILAETEGTYLARRVFKKCFNRFVKELYSPTALWRSIYVFDGMELNGKSFNLDKYTTIMPISEGKIKSLIPWHDKYFSLSEILYEGQSLSPVGNAILVITKQIDKKYEGSPWPSGKDLNSRERAVTALAAIRLTQRGSVYAQFWGEFQVSNFPVLEPIGLDARPDFGLRFYQHKVEIKDTDRHDIRSTWKRLMEEGYGKVRFKRQSPPSRMEIARDRFFKSYEDDNWFDSLLDLTIALEALFGPSDTEELRHRIALRCAWLLGTGQDTKDLYRSVRLLYDLRSHIVHGSAPRKKDIQKFVRNTMAEKLDSYDEWELEELAAELARDVVRRSIEGCSNLANLPTSGPHWPFDNDFDQLMIVPDQQKCWQKAAGVLNIKK